ncbi:hypothetical protein DPMN_165891 [Dreissena polymorpha]|uniref:Uncharacterized protein n=1 Tax=Dreissena polymorpha TaxID=45954 RepID=A0A9D4IX33_DREPO|nr:hypothetical protein DPMN_165891 [Dreissena polymorpha]
MAKYQFFHTSDASHPYAHRLRLKPTTSIIQRMAPERSLTVTNLHITPRTAFEMERPQTKGSPRVVVINTSFRTAYPERVIQRNRLTSFPKLSSADRTRQTNNSRLTNYSLGTVNRRPSTQSFRVESGSANRLSARFSNQQRVQSSGSDRIQGNEQRAGIHRTFLTQRQTTTFSAYAKYNDIVNSTRARERASESPITSNNNDLSALVPQKLTRSTTEMILSNEKHVWITDWLASTSAAMRLDNRLDEASPIPTTLSIIHEQ